MNALDRTTPDADADSAERNPFERPSMWYVTTGVQH